MVGKLLLLLCTDGVPTSANLTCSTGSYCDSTSSSYCSTTVCTDDPPAYYNCTSAHILCSNSTTLGILVPRLFECPTTTVFDPSTAKCVLPTAYTCPDGTDLTTVASETNACNAAGRFGNTTDTTCQSYYFCYQLDTNTSTYNITDFTCPTTTVFNPSTKKCVLPTAYTCAN